MTRTNTKRQLDRLIDWYKAHNPKAGRVIRVNCSERTLRRIGARKVEGNHVYRGRVLVIEGGTHGE